MAKQNFLLVDLNETKTKKLAETITSDTSRKILNHLTEKDDTETNIAKELTLPISTIHYHLQKLKEAGLVIIEEFHYSQKGKEVNHYKLANKYIIIAPKKISGLKQKLKGILPVAGIILGIGALIKFINLFSSKTVFASEGIMKSTVPIAEEMAMNDVVAPTTQRMFSEAAPLAQQVAAETTTTLSAQPDIAFWFIIGGFSAIIIYLLVNIVKEWLRNKKS